MPSMSPTSVLGCSCNLGRAMCQFPVPLGQLHQVAKHSLTAALSNAEYRQFEDYCQ